MGNPYSSISDYQMLYKSVSTPAPGLIDPVTRRKTISIADRIATMGLKNPLIFLRLEKA